MVEDLTSDPNCPAVRITQVSDLGPASTWLPSSIVKMVASTLVPRSMSGIRKVTEKIQVPRALSSSATGKEGAISTKINGDGDEVEKLKGAGGEWPIARALPGTLGEGALDFSQDEEKEIQTPGEEIKTEVLGESQVGIHVSHSISASASAREEQERLAREAGENLSKSMRRISMLLARTDSDENTSGNSSELESSEGRSDDEDEDEESSGAEDDNSRDDEPKELADSGLHQDVFYSSSPLSKNRGQIKTSTEEEAIEQLNGEEHDLDSLSNSIHSLQRSVTSSPISNGARSNSGMRLGLGLGLSGSSASSVQGTRTPPILGTPNPGVAQEDLSPFSSACSSSSYFSHGTSNDGGWRGKRPAYANGLTGGVYAGMGLQDDKIRRATLNLARHVVGGPTSSAPGSEGMSRSQSAQSQGTRSINGRSEMSEDGEYSENESFRGPGSSVGGNVIQESDDERPSKEDEDDEEDYDRTLLSSAFQTNFSPHKISPNRLLSLNTSNLSSPHTQIKPQSSSPTSNLFPAASSPPTSPTKRIGATSLQQSPLRRQHDFSPRIGELSSRNQMEDRSKMDNPSTNEEAHGEEQSLDERYRGLPTLQESPDMNEALEDSQDSQGDLALLLADALGTDLRPPSLRRKPLGTSSRKNKRSARAEGSNFSIRSGVGSPSRREAKLEREAKRLSAMLLMGSDQLAMSIAPGARGGSAFGIQFPDDGDEFGISDIVIEDSEEDEVRIGMGPRVPNLDSTQQLFTSQSIGLFSNSQFLGPGDGKPSAEGRRPSADSSGSSAHTTTGLEASTNALPGNRNSGSLPSPSLAASLFSRSRRVSENNITVASSPAPPTTTATSVWVGSAFSERASASNDVHHTSNPESSMLENLQPHEQPEEVKAEKSRRWPSALAGAPYTLVIGLASLAWATRYSSQSKTNHQPTKTDVVTPDGTKVTLKQRAPSSSAADAVRRVMHGDMERRNTAPPIAFDGKVPMLEASKGFIDSPTSTTTPLADDGTFPNPSTFDLGNVANQTKYQTISVLSTSSSSTASPSRQGTLTSPPLGLNNRSSTSATSIKSSSSSIRSRSSKLYSYNGVPAVIPEDGSVDRAFSRSNYAQNDKLHPFPASIWRKELPPIGNGIGAVPLDVREREEEEEVAARENGPKKMERVEAGGMERAGSDENASNNVSYLSWISGYLPATGR